MGSRKLSRGGFVSWREAGTRPTSTMPSSLNYSWNVRGTFNGDFIGASGTTASVDGVAEVHGTAGEGAPFSHSSWIWGGMAHYGLGYMKGGHKVNPCEKYPYHMTRHWYGEDGSHIGLPTPSPEPRELGLVTLPASPSTLCPKVPFLEATFAANTHPIGLLQREATERLTSMALSHSWLREAEPTPPTFMSTSSSGNHVLRSIATTGSLSTLRRSTTQLTGTTKRRLLLIPTGTLENPPPRRWASPGICLVPLVTSRSLLMVMVMMVDTASTIGARVEKDGENMVFLISTGHLPGRDMLACTSSPVSPKERPTLSTLPCLRDSPLRESGGDKTALTGPLPTMSSLTALLSTKKFAVPKGNDHIWYRSTFQFELNNGAYYTGYWEMDIHFRKALEPGQMPNPYVVKFWPETWDSKPFYWHFYEREEVEQ